MNITPHQRVIFINAPEEAVEEMDLPELEIKDRLSGKFDHIIFFVVTQAEFHKRFPVLKKYLKDTGTLWAAWPKAKQLGTDLEIKSVIRIGYEYGLVESKNLRINEVWTALKFTHPKEGKIYRNSYGTLKK